MQRFPNASSQFLFYDQTSSCRAVSTKPSFRATAKMTYLILIPCPHILHNLLCLRFRNPSLLHQNLGQDTVDLAGHVGRVTADIEVGLLREQVADLLGTLFHLV